MITADLEYLGQRLDAADKAGQKGAHDEVQRFDASRYITGTYLLSAMYFAYVQRSP